MERKQAEGLQRALEQAGVAARTYAGYSGRGMYGATTDGVVSGDLERMVALARRRRIPVRQDSLGRDYIIY